MKTIIVMIIFCLTPMVMSISLPRELLRSRNKVNRLIGTNEPRLSGRHRNRPLHDDRHLDMSSEDDSVSSTHQFMNLYDG